MEGERTYAKTMRIDLLGNSRSADAKVSEETELIRSISAGDHAGDFEVLLHSLYDAAILTGFTGPVITANSRALRFFGHDLDSIRACIVSDLISGVDADVLDTVIENVQADRFTLLQAYCTRVDGTVFPAEISVTQLELAACSCLCFFIRDITVRRQVEESLRIEGEAIRNAGNGIAITDPEGTISYTNPAMAALWRCDAPERLAETRLQALFTDPGSITNAIDTALHSGTWHGELEACGLNGKPMFVQIAITSCIDDEDCITNLVFSFTDITKRRRDEQSLMRYQDHLEELISERTAELKSINTALTTEVAERKRVEEELRQAIRKLHEHDEAKNLFVSNVSHELRTPLTSLIHAIENLMRGVSGPLSDDVYSYLTMMLEDCWRLDRTVHDILDLSRLETGRLVLSPREVPFVRMVERTAAAMRMIAETIPLTFAMDPDPAFGFVECDAAKIERVLLNVISNAIKFTPPGGRIAIQVMREARHGREGICCCIRDTGIGIPRQFLTRVTERFFRIGEQVEGTGLGLAISREIIERHEGAIELLSPAGGQENGTEVRLWLPVVAPHRIVVATGDPDLCQALCPALARRGYETECAGSGSAVVQMLRDGNHRIAIIHAGLSDMDGVEAIMHIKADAGLRHIRVFYLADAAPAEVKAAILEGFTIPVFLRAPDCGPFITAIEDAFLPNRIAHR